MDSLNQIILLIVIGIPLFAMPVNLLIVASIIGVMLADTRLIPTELIYYTRLMPIGILAFRVLLAYFVGRTAAKSDLGMMKAWLFFMLLASISVGYSLEPSISIQRVLSGWLVLIGFAVAIPMYFQKPQDTTRLIWLVSIFMGAAIIYSFYSMTPEQSIPAGAQDYERFYGIFRNPNTLGLLSMQALFPTAYLWQKNSKKTVRNILFAVMVLLGIAIIISGSRAAALGFSIGLMVFLWGSRKIQQKSLPTVVMIILLITSIYLTVGYFFPEYSGGLFRTGTSGRTTLIEKEWDLAKETPYFGAGFGGSDGLYIRDAWHQRLQGIYAAGSHNSFMRLLVELGFAGLILALYAFSALIYRSIKILRQFEDPQLGIALLSVVAASLINAFFEAWLFSFGSSATIPFWLFLSLLYYQLSKAKSSRSQTSERLSSMPQKRRQNDLSQYRNRLE
jgi:O-antigen ligase